MTGRHSRRATRALQRLAETDPAFASLALWVDHADADVGPDAPPAWSTATTVFYGPAFDALSLAEQMGLCGHHLLHVAFRHAHRASALRLRLGDGYDATVFNLASDAILNEAVLRAGYILPRPCVLLTELLGDVLGDRDAPDAALVRWDVEALTVRLLSSGAGTDSDSGRARAHAEAAGFRRDLDEEGAGGEAGPDDAGDWCQRISRAMEAGRAAGRGIGILGHRLADLPQSRTPWEIVLRALVTKAVTQLPRQSWHRPTGRWLAADASGHETPFDPALARTARAPRIAVGIDSSGSIDDARLALFSAQIAGIARRTGAETHVLVFDDGVHHTRVLKAGHWDRGISDLPLARDGGTDFTEVLREADRLDPAAIVILTDLDGPMGAKPRAPVIWAVPDDVSPPPPFGRVLSLAR